MSNNNLAHLGLALVLKVFGLDLGLEGLVVIALYVLAASCVALATWHTMHGRGGRDD